MDKGSKLFEKKYKKHKKDSVFFNFENELKKLNSLELKSFLELCIKGRINIKAYIEWLYNNRKESLKEILINTPSLLDNSDICKFILQNDTFSPDELYLLIKKAETGTELLKTVKYSYLKENFNSALSLKIRKDLELLDKIEGIHNGGIDIDDIRLLKIYSEDSKGIGINNLTLDSVIYQAIKEHNILDFCIDSSAAYRMKIKSIESKISQENLIFIKEFIEKNFDSPAFMKQLYERNLLSYQTWFNEEIFPYLLSEKIILKDESFYNIVKKRLETSIVKTDNIYDMNKEGNFEITVLEHYHFKDNISRFGDFIFKNEEIVRKLIKDIPEFVFFQRCNLEESLILEAIDKIDKNRLFNTIDKAIDTGDFSELQNTTIFSNKTLVTWLIEKNGNYFNLVDSELAKSEELYEKALQNGLIINPKITNQQLYTNPTLINQFYEKYQKKDQNIINQIKDKIGIGCLLYLKNDILLEKEVVETFGLDNICKIIKYIEVPGLINNLNDLFNQFGVKTIANLYEKNETMKNFKKINIKAPLDIISFIKFCTILTENQNNFSQIENIEEFYDENILVMSKIFQGEKIGMNTKEDMQQYGSNMLKKLSEDLKRINQYDPYYDINKDLVLKSFLEKFLPFYSAPNSINWLAEYSSNTDPIDLFNGKKSSFELIYEELKSKDNNEEMQDLAKMLQKTLEIQLNSLYNTPNIESYVKKIIELLKTKEGQKQIVLLNSCIYQFEKLAKKLYAYEYKINITKVDNVALVDTIDGVEIHELQGEEFYLPLHTRDFASSSNSNNTEKEIGKDYLCWSLSSSIHPGYARSKNAITYVYGNVADDELLLGAPYDMYSSGSKDNNPNVNSLVQNKLLPCNLLNKYCLQRFNEIVSRRNTFPTAIMVENRSDITSKHIEAAKKLNIPIISENIELYKKNHVAKIKKALEKLEKDFTSNNVEDYIYLATTYLVAYDNTNFVHKLQEKAVRNPKYGYALEEEYEFDIYSNAIKYIGDENFNLNDAKNQITVIMDKLNKMVSSPCKVEIIKILNKFLDNTKARESESEESIYYAEYTVRRLGDTIKKFLANNPMLTMEFMSEEDIIEDNLNTTNRKK